MYKYFAVAIFLLAACNNAGDSPTVPTKRMHIKHVSDLVKKGLNGSIKSVAYHYNVTAEKTGTGWQPGADRGGEYTVTYEYDTAGFLKSISSTSETTTYYYSNGVLSYSERSEFGDKAFKGYVDWSDSLTVNIKEYFKHPDSANPPVLYQTITENYYPNYRLRECTRHRDSSRFEPFDLYQLHKYGAEDATDTIINKDGTIYFIATVIKKDEKGNPVEILVHVPDWEQTTFTIAEYKYY
jgi:hypothetical protein